MASDKEERNKSSEGAGANEAAASTTGKKGGSKKLLVLGGIGFGAVVIGVAVALFVIKPMMSKAGDPDHAATTATSGHDGGSDSHGSAKSKHKGGHGAGQVHICDIEDIVINPAGTGGSRYLSASLSFELESAPAAALFEKREPIIRDALITILSSKTVAQLTDIKQKEIVRYQIKKRVAELLHTDELAGVYYTDFVLQ